MLDRRPPPPSCLSLPLSAPLRYFTRLFLGSVFGLYWTARRREAFFVFLLLLLLEMLADVSVSQQRREDGGEVVEQGEQKGNAAEMRGWRLKLKS